MPDTRRYYLRSSGAAAVSPAFGALWDNTASADRLAMSETPANTANLPKGVAEVVSATADYLIRQYVGPADLPAGDVAGQFRVVIPAEESNSDMNAWLQCRAAVYDSTGATHRGDVYAGQAQLVASAVSTDPNYEFDVTPTRRTRVLDVVLTPVTAQAGDRLVVELGYRFANTNTGSRTATLHFGDENVDTDYAFTVNLAQSATNRPWCEFVLDDPLGPPDVPTSLAVTPSPDGTELEFDWAAPAAGFAPDGYDVRIDGGAATDVGNVLTHDFTGLTPDTAYTLEVRAYNAAGDSSWVSIGGTTTAPPDTPTGLVATPGPTSVTLTWNASTGSPDGYEVSVDNGAPVDIGNVLTYEFEDLYPGADYLLEVRAYNEAGFSGWASISSETPTPTDSEYTAEITLGSHTWEITSGECEFGDVVVLDGLTIGWQADESKPWPAQPNPVTANLGLYVADVVDLADVGIGTPLSIVLTDVVDNVFATFHGRVSQMTAQAKANGPVGLYMLYSLTAVDYTVDLAEYPVTIPGEWPAESADARFTRIIAAIGVVTGDNVGVAAPVDTGSASFEALSAGTTDAYSLVMSHLDQIAVDNGNGPQRYILVPVVDASTGELGGFECVLLDRTVDASLLPGVLDVVDGELVLTFPDMDAGGVIDACAVDLGATWNRFKYRAVNHVTVAGSTVTAEASRAGPPVRLNLSTTLTDQPAAERMAALYLPDLDEANGWVADTFRLYAYKEPAAIVPAWFPDHRSFPAVTSVYVMPLALLGVAAPVNLSGAGEIYAGQLVKVAVTIAKSRVYVDFGLRRILPNPAGADALTWDDVSALWPTLTWDDVSAGLSWYDARLGKAP